MEISVEVPQKIKTTSPYDSLPPLKPKGIKGCSQDRYLHECIFCGTVHNSQDMELA
jgi:hypothetical protein